MSKTIALYKVTVAFDEELFYEKYVGHQDETIGMIVNRMITEALEEVFKDGVNVRPL